MRTCALLLIPLGLAAALPASADSSTTRERTITAVADGVWMIRHEDSPDTFPQSNTTVVIGERDVLVVDSGYLPSTARKDIEQIRKWTPKPVRWLVNTHWHYDHTMGNAAYREAFPAISIVAQIETRKQIAGYNPGWFARFPDRARQFRKLLETGKDGNGRELSETEKQEYRDATTGLEPVGREYESLAGKLEALTPDVGFEQALRIDLGRREVDLRFLGRGNTAGDAVVFLPAERILVAGDLVVHPVPYLGGGYPTEFISTLKRLRELEPAKIVPGHGELLSGTGYVGELIDFLSVVVAAVDRHVFRIGNGYLKLDEVKQAVEKEIDLPAWRSRFTGNDPASRDTFDGFSWPGLIRTAHGEICRR